MGPGSSQQGGVDLEVGPLSEKASPSNQGEGMIGDRVGQGEGLWKGRGGGNQGSHQAS